MKKQYGKCIGVEGAYQEAVTGEDSGAPLLYKISEGKDSVSSQDLIKNDGVGLVNHQNSYRDFQAERYNEMKDLIKKPITPMLTPPKTVRTLIVSYSPDFMRKRLYMPRYVFSIVEDSKFIMGQFETAEDQSLKIFQ